MKSRLLNILFWSVISAAFIGPGTVTTAAKAGSDFGLPLLWALTFATIACLVLQEAAARLTISSGMDLGQAIRFQSGGEKSKPAIPLLVVICILTGTAAYQTGNLLGAVAGIKLLVDLPSWLMVFLLGLMAGILLLIPSVKVIARIMGGIVALMGIAFIVSAIAIKPPVYDLFRGMMRPIIPLNGGGGLLVLGLIGTTVVPYNLFLGSGLSKGQSLKEMRSGLFVAVILGGIISMAVLVTGSSMSAEFTFGGLAESLSRYLGGMGTVVLGVGLLAAGFTSAVTAPLASAVTVRSLFGNSDPERWRDGSSRFRMIWVLVLLTGVGFGMAGFKPVPAIIVAQALNGLILPLIAIFLLVSVNNRSIMKAGYNNLPGNILMTSVVFITLLIGLAGIARAVLKGINAEPGNWSLIMLIIAIISFVIVGSVLLKISSGKKNI
ncbi:MAG TPA: divalent metal cation transporter [Bacteroides sp.]|nr:divalent metal cation transporter [Bacteroides sp.]